MLVNIQQPLIREDGTVVLATDSKVTFLPLAPLLLSVATASWFPKWVSYLLDLQRAQHNLTLACHFTSGCDQAYWDLFWGCLFRNLSWSWLVSHQIMSESRLQLSEYSVVLGSEISILASCLAVYYLSCNSLFQKPSVLFPPLKD